VVEINVISDANKKEKAASSGKTCLNSECRNCLINRNRRAGGARDLRRWKEQGKSLVRVDES